MLKKINDLKRKKALQKITGNLGFVIEKEEKLICYVQKEKCHFYEGYPSDSYVIRIEDYKNKNKELIEKYVLDKEIVYVLDGLTFEKKEPVIINYFDDASRVEIKNCRFDSGLIIDYPKECIIKNTIINNDYFGYQCEIKARDLILDNVDINNNDNRQLMNTVAITASNSIKIKNSTIKAATCEIGNLKTKEVSIEDSNLSTSRRMQIMTNDITAKKSSVISDNYISIYAGAYDKMSGLSLSANLIDINEERVTKTSIELPIYLKALDDLDSKRLELLNLLKDGIEDLERRREEKLSLVKKNYNEQQVGKLILRRKK